MLLPGFGSRFYNKPTLLDKILEQGKQLDNIAAQVVMRDAYETQYGICDHGSPSANPLALVEYQAKEDVSEYGTLYRTFYQYHLYEVHKEWGVSIVDFLNMPREYCALMLRISSEKAARMTAETQKQIRAAQQAQAAAGVGLGGAKR